jgi:CBS domain-containing protein
MKWIDSINSVLELKGRQVWSVDPATVVFEAIRTMSNRGVGALLVMSEGRLKGILSERDYARKVILRDRSSKMTQVREIMTTPVLTVTPKDTVEDCMRLMTEYRIRHLPVLEGDRVVGIVSIGDLVNWIVTAQEEMIGQLEGYICGKYPG